MNLSVIISVLGFFGGLGLFIYGMEVMAEGLSQAAGTKTRALLESLTRNRLMAVLAGALVTAIIQSSSAVTVLVVGFVNASLMSLTQAAGVIMGANIGTTMTAWIVSMGEWAQFLKPEMIAPLFLVIGVGIQLFARSGRKKDFARILIGFGMLFTGLSTMSGAIDPYVDQPIFSQAFSMIGSNPLLGILVGALVTAVIQSSSASLGILQTLAAAGAVNWGSAVFIALGQNIGTCVTALLSAISGDTNAKRAAMIHLEFNVIGALIATGIACVYFMIVPSMAQASVSATALALFHTGFNIAVTIILFPFANQLVALSKFLLPSKEKEKEEAAARTSLDARFLALPEAAFSAVHMEIAQIAEGCSSLIEKSRTALIDRTSLELISTQAASLQHDCREIRKYLGKIDPSALTLDDQKSIQKYLLQARDLLQISVTCTRIASLQTAEESIELKENSIEIINTLSSLCSKAVLLSVSSDHARDKDKIYEYAKEVLHIDHTLADYLSFAQSKSESALKESWIMMETADLYLQIMRRVIRIENETSWKNPGLLELSAG